MMRRFLSVLATTSVAIAAFASPALAQQTTNEDLLARFPDLVPSPDVLAWLSDSDRWRRLGRWRLRDCSNSAPRGRLRLHP